MIEKGIKITHGKDDPKQQCLSAAASKGTTPQKAPRMTVVSIVVDEYVR